MHFTLTQICAILAPLAIAFCTLFIWYKKDCTIDKKEHQEKLTTLISVFFWAAFGALMLKIIIDLVYHYDSSILLTGWFLLITIFLEEFIKGGSLIVGLEMADHRFNEVSDGIIYGVMAALGFLFFENIFYLLATTGQQEFWTVVLSRSLSTFGIHLLSTGIFGLTYAKAYLGYKQRMHIYQKKYNLSAETLIIPKPYNLFHHFKYILTMGNVFLNFIKLLTCYDLLKRILLILTQHENLLFHKKRFLVFPSVFIVEGFLLGFYLHLGCNHLLQNEMLGWLLLTIMPVFGFVVYLGFWKLDSR